MKQYPKDFIQFCNDHKDFKVTKRNLDLYLTVKECGFHSGLIQARKKENANCSDFLVWQKSRNNIPLITHFTDTGDVGGISNQMRENDADALKRAGVDAVPQCGEDGVAGCLFRKRNQPITGNQTTPIPVSGGADGFLRSWITTCTFICILCVAGCFISALIALHAVGKF